MCIRDSLYGFGMISTALSCLAVVCEKKGVTPKQSGLHQFIKNILAERGKYKSFTDSFGQTPVEFLPRQRLSGNKYYAVFALCAGSCVQLVLAVSFYCYGIAVIGSFGRCVGKALAGKVGGIWLARAVNSEIPVCRGVTEANNKSLVLQHICADGAELLEFAFQPFVCDACGRQGMLDRPVALGA